MSERDLTVEYVDLALASLSHARRSARPSVGDVEFAWRDVNAAAALLHNGHIRSKPTACIDDLADLATSHVHVTIGPHGALTPLIQHIVHYAVAGLVAILDGDLGGRLEVRIATTGATLNVTLDTMRPGSWSDALRRERFHSTIESISRGLLGVAGDIRLSRRSFDGLTVSLEVPS